MTEKNDATAPSLMKTETIMEFLKEEGYRPRVDDDGDISFKKEGASYFVFPNEDDPTFLSLSMPFVHPVENDDDKQKALWAINEINCRYKVVKMKLVGEWVWASVEMFQDPFQSFTNVVPRALDIFGLAAVEFEKVFSAGPQAEGE